MHLKGSSFRFEKQKTRGENPTYSCSSLNKIDNSFFTVILSYLCVLVIN